MERTLVIGDTHGHFDRLEALLLSEQIIGSCPDCGGRGDQADGFCSRCDGDGVCRINFQSKVIQLGDLGHFGSSYIPGKGMVPVPSGGDLLCYQAVRRRWIDIILWGNHDRAVFDEAYHFSGYIPPPAETMHIMRSLLFEGRIVFAAYVHGFLLTHAGLHAQFRYQKVDDNLKSDPEAFVDWINTELDFEESKEQMAVRGAIGRKRSGPSPYGGILWRDATEKLYKNFKQIFGHSSGKKIRRYPHSQYGTSYCIDIGDADNGRLAAIWLPDEKLVEIKI
jgi:hypothetical protein